MSLEQFNEKVQEKSINTKELLKETLRDNLSKGIDIKNKEEYDKYVTLLKENSIIDLSNASFDDISKDGGSIAIKRINNDTHVTIFSTYTFFGMNPDGPFSKWGVINNGGKIERFLDKSITYSPNNKGATNLDTTKKETQKKSIRTPAVYSKEPVKWEKSEPKQNNKTKEFLLPTLDTTYTVKKGDSLWNIAKTFYPTSDNRELANVINAIVRYNKVQFKLNTLDNKPTGGDGIKGDTIIIGKTILIPTELKVLGKIINRNE